MLFRFPDLDALRLAVTSGLVPAEVTAAPASASRVDDTVVVDTASKFPKASESDATTLLYLRRISR